ncbi:hypothetical protein [Streptomonospora litoralis]|uniref:Uncharacterized protein n=1 Tax=Streptomonospora litoralis TaxID=2498135 RepID=A0A4P6Q707_9ACTN|nr:hypothetical protein [Streptomonospora litoralis]QBI54704.1 hypothetical protein EKD16_14620 [Streptomonospora litoralis]
MSGASAPFVVTNRFRVTWEGAWLTVACLVFTGIGVALMLRGGVVDIVMGLLAVLVFGGAGAASITRLVSPRPVLELDGHGARFPAPWPRSTREDIVLAWGEISLLRACTQVVPHRGGTVSLHYLDFVPVSEADRPFRTPTPWRSDHAVRVRPTWDHSLDEIVAAVHTHRPEMPFEDRREPRNDHV